MFQGKGEGERAVHLRLGSKGVGHEPIDAGEANRARSQPQAKASSTPIHPPGLEFEREL